MNKQEAVERFGEMMIWYGRHETDCEASRRQIGRSRQYMARYARYAYHRDSNNRVSNNIVEITICTAQHNEVAKTTVHKKIFDARPVSSPQTEVEWACKQCGINI